MKCLHCNSARLRVSRFRKQDWLALLLLHYPIRCRDCHMREYVWFPQVLQVRHESKLRGQQNEHLRRKGSGSTVGHA